jgi:hypothetical protein
VLGTTQGKLYGCGSNYYGQLAGKTAVGDFTFKPLPIVAPALEGRKLVDENAGEWDFNPDPRPLTTCHLMDREFCDQYTMLSSSVGSDLAIILTAAKVCLRV